MANWIILNITQGDTVVQLNNPLFLQKNNLVGICFGLVVFWFFLQLWHLLDEMERVHLQEHIAALGKGAKTCSIWKQ